MKKTFIKVLDLKSANLLPALAFLSVFFLCGSVAGCATASYIGGDGSSSLVRYVTGYISMVRENGAGSTDLLTAFFNTFKYHIAAFIIGFTSLGIAFIPALMAIRGFFLSFAVTSFVKMFGASGLLLSVGIFGFQRLLTLPCLFVISVQAFSSSNALFLMATGKRKKSPTPLYGGAYFTRCGICVVVLIFCSLFEAFITPAIISVIVANI
jgi:stage II sporulation protein M